MLSLSSVNYLALVIQIIAFAIINAPSKFKRYMKLVIYIDCTKEKEEKVTIKKRVVD